MTRFGLILLATFGIAGVSRGGDRPTGSAFVTRSEVFAPRNMAATAHPLATQAALNVLGDGGSAVDAAIAANAVLGVVEPTGCGIGGDLFAIVWDAQSERLYGLDASGRSPGSLDLEDMKKVLAERKLTAIPSRGGLPISVPGAVDGWFSLHRRFGKLGMDRVLADAIRLAREGSAVPEVIADHWHASESVLGGFPEFRRVFLPGGRAPRKGEVFTNPDLASSYEVLVNEGRDGFYRGPVAQAIAAAAQGAGGFLSAEDLARHSSRWVKPLRTRYRGYDVWQIPPAGQGIAVLQMLNILEGYDLRRMGFGSAEVVHLLVEAKKLAFADRARFVADPEFSQVPIDTLISKPYARERRRGIGPMAAKLVEAGMDGGETTYLAVADAQGNMVSLIQSNYRGMGSGVVPVGLGFGLQDRGESFSLDPSHPNAYAARKRPFHTIIPGFVTRSGVPWLAFGVMGGAAQPQMQVQVLINLIDFEMNLQEAGDAPRVLHVGADEVTVSPTIHKMDMSQGGAVHLERGFSSETMANLKKRGHHIVIGNAHFGGYQAIARPGHGRGWIGATESRKDGLAAGD